jgi:hypothetical protein
LVISIKKTKKCRKNPGDEWHRRSAACEIWINEHTMHVVNQLHRICSRY